MPLKSVRGECGNPDCESRERRDVLATVRSLDELKAGDPIIDELCHQCGSQLRVVLSAPRLSFGGRGNGEQDHGGGRFTEVSRRYCPDGGPPHRHFVRKGDPNTEATVVKAPPEIGGEVVFLETGSGSPTAARLRENGLEPAAVTTDGAHELFIGRRETSDAESGEPKTKEKLN